MSNTRTPPLHQSQLTEDRPDAYRYAHDVSVKGHIEKGQHLNWKLIFERKIKPRIAVRETGCWEFLGTKNDRGYGTVGVGSLTDNTRTMMYTHRVTYMAFNGDIERSIQVQHLCNNRCCCNPGHLITGSAKQNMRYMVDCGRMKRWIGPSGLLGVRWHRTIEGYEYWVASYSLPDRRRVTLYQGKDFFRACCARKSWEAKRTRFSMPILNHVG